jgi:hypothetical protein
MEVSKSTRLKKGIGTTKRKTYSWAVDLKRPPDAMTPKKWNELTRELVKLSVSAVSLKPRTIRNGSKK